MGYEFDPKDVYGLAEKIGAEIKQKGNELFFKWCPYCKGDGHDKETFSVNLDNGAFKCFRAGCGKQGHFVQMAKDFHYQLDFGTLNIRKFKPLPQKRVTSSDYAVEYLAGRGISKEITQKYKVTTLKENHKILAFPFYDQEGVLRFVKYRKTDFDKERDKNKEWAEKDTMPILFGMDQCEGFERLVITEGQIDSLSLAEAGIRNPVSVPNGARGFTWVENCWDWISKFKEVVVFGDCENGKITLVDELGKRLSCILKVVKQEDYLGEKDANDILRKYGKDALVSAVNNAEVIPVSHVKRLADVETVDLQSLPHIITGFRELDRAIGGIYFGQVILLTGKRGEGKSTLMSQMIAEAINQGYKVLAYSGELPDYHFRNWLDLQIAGPENIQTKYNRFSDPVYYLDEETSKKIGEWYYGSAFLYDNNSVEGEDEYEGILATVEKAIKRYGIKMVCIDNLMTAIDVTNAENQYVEQSKFVRSLKRLAVKYDAAIILVAHPKKTQGEISDNDSVSGSSDITNRVDSVISYVKNKEGDVQGGKILVLKNRMSGKLVLGDSAVNVYYDQKSRRIYSSSGNPNYSYGWKCEKDNSDWPEDLPF